MGNRCHWSPCAEPREGLSVYCADHREQARRNVLRALGFAARSSLMYRPGDDDWLFPTSIGGKGPS